MAPKQARRPSPRRGPRANRLSRTHPLSSVAQTVLDAIETGGGDARIHLQPRELGDVVIHIRASGDRVEVMVQAERAEAVNILRDNAQDLTCTARSAWPQPRRPQRQPRHASAGPGLGQANNQPNNRLRGESEFANALGADPASTTNHNKLRTAYNPDGAHLYRI